MEFLHFSGQTLFLLLQPEEFQPSELREAGVTDECEVRMNRDGELEVLRNSRWIFIGGILGNFSDRVEKATGHAWQTESV